MTLRALILVIALVIGSSADAQQCPSHFPGNNPCPDPAFQNKICYMQDHFDPATLDPTKGGYNTPNCAGAAVPERYTALLTAAYHLAPSKVKAALCQLHKIFVTRDASYGPPRPPIGVWEAHGRGGGHVWIAIPDYILENASSLDHAENGILGGLFVHPTPPVPPPYPPWPPSSGRSLPTFSPSNGLKDAEILAVLAHELGHIMLAETNADGQPGRPGRPCDAPAAPSCFSTYFLAGWNAVAPLPAPAFKQRRWIAFNDPNSSIRYGSAPGFANIAADIALGTAAGDRQATMDTYQGIYSGPTFVSVFAALSPEEDYAETYKYKTLGAAGGGSLNLSISLPNFTPASVNVLAPVRSPPSGALQNKLNCVPAVN